MREARVRKYRYQRPGLHRAGDVRRQIENRLHIEMPKWRFEYLEKKGIIEPPTERIQSRKGSGLFHRAWSDVQVERIIGAVSGAIERLPEPSHN